MALTLAGGAALASLLATGAGIYKQNKSSDEAAALGRSRFSAEMLRQAEMDAASKGKVADSLAQFDADAMEKSKSGIVADNLENVASLISQEAPISFGTKNAPTVIKDVKGASSKAAQRATGAFAKALAEYGGQGQALAAANLNMGANAQGINRINRDKGISAGMLANEMINRDKGISAGMLANEMNTAANSAYSPIGHAATTVGQAGLSASLSGQLGDLGGGVDQCYKLNDPLSPSNLKPTTIGDSFAGKR